MENTYSNYIFAAITNDLHIKLFIMALSKEDRKYIQLGLPRGAQAEVARNLGITRIAVNQYLAGVINSTRIEMAVVTKFEEVKKMRAELRKRIYE